MLGRVGSWERGEQMSRSGPRGKEESYSKYLMAPWCLRLLLRAFSPFSLTPEPPRRHVEYTVSFGVGRLFSKPETLVELNA